MKLSLNFVKEYIDLPKDLTVEKLQKTWHYTAGNMVKPEKQ
jgi:hypothetical protein